MIFSLAFLFINHDRVEKKKSAAINLERQFEKSNSPKRKNILDKKNNTKPDMYNSEKEANTKPDMYNSEKEANTKPYMYNYKKKADSTTAYEAVGVLRIDDIGLVMPVFKSTSRNELMNGCGIVENTDFPSNERGTITVLAAHRGGRNENFTFMKIDKLKEGSEIKVTTRNQILYYEVYGYEVVKPTDWSRFIREEGKTKLYLMSCHPYPRNDHRILVKSELKKYVDK